MITVGITTFNRAKFWRGRYLWNSLVAQTNPKNITLIVADDGSTDGTVELLLELRKSHPFAAMRIFSLAQEHQAAPNDNCRPMQVTFKYAAGDIFVGLDDDGWVDPAMTEMLTRLYRHYGPHPYYGCLDYVDPDALDRGSIEPIRIGKNGTVMDPRRWWCEKENLSVARIDGEWLNGPMWSMPVNLLREMGGHCMEYVGMAGNDWRLGRRLQQARVPCYFVELPEFTFHHIGLPLYATMELAGKLGEYLSFTAKPEDQPFMANGGATGWDRLEIEHREL